MLRPFALLFVALPVLAVADLKGDLQAKYRQFDSAIASRDIKAVSAWIAKNTTPDFSYTSEQKRTYKRKEFESQIRQQISLTKKTLTALTRVSSVKNSGGQLTLGVDSKTVAILTVEGRTMKVEDTSHTADTWVRSGGSWRLKRSLQTKGNTNFYQPTGEK